MKPRYGHMGKFLFVDLTNRKVREEELTEKTGREYIGGYGFGVRVLMERMKPGVDPLGPDNILGIGTGPLTGTGVASTSRFTTMGKSPLTGYWGDANCGVRSWSGPERRRGGLTINWTRHRTPGSGRGL